MQISVWNICKDLGRSFEVLQVLSLQMTSTVDSNVTRDGIIINTKVA